MVNKLQWTLLSSLLMRNAVHAPVQDAEVESLVMLSLLKSKLQQFTFWDIGCKQKKISLSPAEAFAINKFFAPISEEYNVHLRMIIEPKLPPCNPIESF